MPIKSILRGIPLLFGSKEVAVELEYPPKSFKTQWPTTLIVSHIHVFMDKFVGAYIFVPLHHFTCGGEDDWCRVKVADVPAMGSHLRKILSVMKMVMVLVMSVVMVLVTKMMMLMVVIALTRGSVNNHVVQFSMLRMHRTLKKKLS